MSRLPTLVACLALAACSRNAESTQEPAPAQLTAEQVELLDIAGGRVPEAGLITGGQITEDQLVALRAAGYETFVTLRPATEDGTGWEEEFAARSGVHFVRIPVAGRGDVNVDNARRLADTIDAAGGRGVVVYCGSGNRVGALFALRSRFVHGEAPEVAMEKGRAAGLTSLEPVVAAQVAAEGAPEPAGG